MHWTEIAARQHGMTSREQLLANGCTRGQFWQLVRGGRLVVTSFTSVYRVAGAPTTPESTQWATVLDTKAVLSYLSAAAWWEMPVASDGLIHVTAPGRRRTVMPHGVRVHRVGLLDTAVTDRFGMPLTTRPETVLDCCGWLEPSPAATLFDRSVQRGWVTAADVQQRLYHQPRRWGNRRLKWLLTQAADGARAESERRMIRILTNAGLGGWRVNLPIVIAGRRYEIDLAFPAQRVAIEIDGWAFHSDVERFRADRRKGNDLVAQGWTVLRFTWADITEHPDRVLRTVTQVLAAA